MFYDKLRYRKCVFGNTFSKYQAPSEVIMF